MHTLLTTFGSHGDVFPFLAIGRALRARGGTCQVAAHPLFHREIEAAGLEALPLFADLPMADILRHPDLFHPIRGPLLGGRYIEPLTLGAAVDLRRHVARHRPDVIVRHYAAIAARWVAEEAGIPSASAVLAPMAWNSAHDPAPAFQVVHGRGHAVGARLASRLVDPPLQLLFERWARRTRAKAGFAGSLAGGTPDPRSVWQEFRSGDLSLGLWAGAFRPAFPDDPPHGVICGFPWHEPPGDPLDPSLEAFLAAGEPPLVFTLGSAAVHNPRDFFTVAAAVCARVGRRGLLLAGRGNTPPSPLPPGVMAVEWASHARLFPRALVNVHHAGIGSTAEALRAGRPSVAIPHAFDQFNNAMRVEMLGAGLTLARHHVTAERLTRAIDRAIRDAAIATQAHALAGRVGGDGASVAARAIERLVESRAERRAAA